MLVSAAPKRLRNSLLIATERAAVYSNGRFFFFSSWVWLGSKSSACLEDGALNSARNSNKNPLTTLLGFFPTFFCLQHWYSPGWVGFLFLL
jgi:hypothetical protein